MTERPEYLYSHLLLPFLDVNSLGVGRIINEPELIALRKIAVSMRFVRESANIFALGVHLIVLTTRWSTASLNAANSRNKPFFTYMWGEGSHVFK